MVLDRQCTVEAGKDYKRMLSVVNAVGCEIVRTVYVVHLTC